MAISLQKDYADAYYRRGLAAYLERGDSVTLVNDWNTYLQLGGKLNQADQSLLAGEEATLTAMPTFTLTPP